VKYKSDVGGEFNVSISVRGEAIKGSPFNLTVKKKTAKGLTGTLNIVLIMFCSGTYAAFLRVVSV